jgi:hypothetical protein
MRFGSAAKRSGSDLHPRFGPRITSNIARCQIPRKRLQIEDYPLPCLLAIEGKTRRKLQQRITKRKTLVRGVSECVVEQSTSQAAMSSRVAGCRGRSCVWSPEWSSKAHETGCVPCGFDPHEFRGYRAGGTGIEPAPCGCGALGAVSRMVQRRPNCPCIRGLCHLIVQRRPKTSSRSVVSFVVSATCFRQ